MWSPQVEASSKKTGQRNCARVRLPKKETLSKLDQKREKRKQSNGIAATVYLCLSFKYISGLLKVLEKKESKKIMGLQQRYIFACLAAAGGFFNLSGRYYSSSRSFLSKGGTHIYQKGPNIWTSKGTFATLNFRKPKGSLLFKRGNNRLSFLSK